MCWFGGIKYWDYHNIIILGLLIHNQVYFSSLLSCHPAAQYATYILTLDSHYNIMID